MNEPLIPIQPTIEDEFKATTTSTTNENKDFCTGIIEVELDELLTNDRNFTKNIIIIVKETDT